MIIINSIKHNSNDYTVIVKISRISENEMGTIYDVLKQNDCYQSTNIDEYFTTSNYYRTFELKHVNNAAMKELERIED